ncbi:unnamed protein product [Effrenium voratum]|nr:unnamed protein product [Effrenium voratum]
MGEESEDFGALRSSLSAVSLSSTPRSLVGPGRRLNRGFTVDSAKRQVLKQWRPDEDSSYACLLSQHTYLQTLSTSLLMVVIASFDRMTSIQLCISLLTDVEFIELRESWEGVLVVWSIVGLVVLYMLIWVLTARGRANAQVQADIDYVGDLVWPTGAPVGAAAERPEGDRLASNFAVRCSLIYFQLFTIPYLVTDVVPLCHPRKGAMKFAALSCRGKMPRVFVLGYVNKVMFHFEETVGILTLLPNMALVKLPCVFFKVYMFVFLQQSGLLMVSLLWDVILNLVKAYNVVSHVRTASAYKHWLAHPQADMSRAARTVREKILKKHFFFHESEDQPGCLEDPGLIGWFWQLFGRWSEEQRSRTGYLGRWTHPVPTPSKESNQSERQVSVDSSHSQPCPSPSSPGSPTAWVERTMHLNSAKSMLRCRPGEEIGRKIIFSSGTPNISAAVVEALSLVDPDTQKVRREFWYSSQGKVVYAEPEMRTTRTLEEEAQTYEPLGEDEWMYGRLLTYSTFAMKLCEALARASCTAFYNIAMLNLLVEINLAEELSGAYDRHILGLFIVSRFIWVYISLRRAQRAIVVDWLDKGEYITNVGCYSRFGLLFSTTIVEMFLMPRMIRDAVSLLHPDKRCHPFAAFGGKLYGPRAFILGFSSKDMYTTQSLHGILSQLPVLLADLALTAGLCWTLRERIGLFWFMGRGAYNYSDDHRERWLWCRLMTWLVLVLTVLNFFLKVAILVRYTRARRRYRTWLKEKVQDASLPDVCRRALKKEWRVYYGELAQVLVSGPLSP